MAQVFPSTPDVVPVPGLRQVGDSTVTRTELVQHSMCGQSSLLCGRIGDWTWDAVSALCGVQVLNAVDGSGAPTYLSFYYYHVRGSDRFHVLTPAVGDLLHVTSTLYDFGSESILTLHRITRTPAGRTARTVSEDPVGPDEFYLSPAPNCLYVENFNRWVTRGGAGNERLLKSSPRGFQHAQLPALPVEFSPRNDCHSARTRHTFLPERPAGYVPVGTPLQLEYPVELSRDLNGVGLLYFATYFAIVDWALLRYWRERGRTDAEFLDRVVLDQKMCYLANANADAVIRVEVRGLHQPGQPSPELVDVVLRDTGTARVLAVCTLRVGGTGDDHRAREKA